MRASKFQIVLQRRILSDGRQCMCLDGKVNASVDVVLGVPHGSVLGPLFILYTSEFFHIVGNHIVGGVDDTMIYAVLQLFLDCFHVFK